MVAIAFISGCAGGGTSFVLPDELEFVLEVTTSDQASELLGEPYFEGKETKNGIEIERLAYVGALSNEPPVENGISPARALNLYFRDGVLIGKTYNSSYASDTTQFDREKAKMIVKGQTEDQVRNLLGAPSGEYRFPLINDEYGFMYIYLYSKNIGVKPYIDLLRVEFNSNKIVTNVDLSLSSLPE